MGIPTIFFPFKDTIFRTRDFVTLESYRVLQLTILVVNHFVVVTPIFLKPINESSNETNNSYWEQKLVTSNQPPGNLSTTHFLKSFWPNTNFQFETWQRLCFLKPWQSMDLCLDLDAWTKASTQRMNAIPFETSPPKEKTDPSTVHGSFNICLECLNLDLPKTKLFSNSAAR